MKKLAALFTGQKLTLKFTIIIFLIVYIPVFVLTNQLLKSTQDTLIQERMAAVSLSSEQLKSRVSKTAEVADVLIKTFSTNDSLLSYLEKALTDEEMDILDKLSFFRHDISALAKFTYSNAYMYQIRVYADSQTMPEMMPVLYRMSRMERLKWASDGSTLSGWHFDYTDSLFPDYVSNRKQHLMALVRPLTDANDVTYGVIEAAIDMEALLPSLFDSQEEDYLFLADSQGNFYYDHAAASEWFGAIETLSSEKHSDTLHSQNKLNGQQVILSYIPVPSIKSELIQITPLDYELSLIADQRLAFYIAMGLGVIILIILIHFTVRTLLKRFYHILKTVHSVQHGDLSVRTEVTGQDEVAVLGRQVNLMLDKINVLMQENTEREILVKNAEIRALHNQINAHFIYNVLESIKMMAEINEQFQLADAVTSLGKLLRYSMRWTKGNVSLEDELEYIQNYLTLINLRFDYQVRLSLSVPEALLKQKIPKISLQPIVENAIGHGLEDINSDTYIYIKAYEENGICTIEVTDPGRGIDEETLNRLQKKIDGAVEPDGGSGHGIGLKNVQDRIRVTFGEEYGLSVQSKLGMYTKVIVTLPVQVQ